METLPPRRRHRRRRRRRRRPPPVPLSLPDCPPTPNAIANHCVRSTMEK